MIYNRKMSRLKWGKIFQGFVDIVFQKFFLYNDMHNFIHSVWYCIENAVGARHYDQHMHFHHMFKCVEWYIQIKN